MTTPVMRPQRPHFSSGPTAKRPGWTPNNLANAELGRSHRSKPAKAKINDSMKRVRTPHTHGTGCTLGSAIATYLAKGETLGRAVGQAVEYVGCAVEESPGIGRGQGPIAHVNSFSRRR